MVPSLEQEEKVEPKHEGAKLKKEPAEDNDGNRVKAQTTTKGEQKEESGEAGVFSNIAQQFGKGSKKKGKKGKGKKKK